MKKDLKICLQLVVLSILSIPMICNIWSDSVSVLSGSKPLIKNPYSPYLYGISGMLAVTAGFINRGYLRVILLFVGTISYWYFLQPFVDWAYTNPFNPDDGGPRTFALLFGWAFGLLFFMIPIFGITHFTKRLSKQRIKA